MNAYGLYRGILARIGVVVVRFKLLKKPPINGGFFNNLRLNYLSRLIVRNPFRGFSFTENPSGRSVASGRESLLK